MTKNEVKKCFKCGGEMEEGGNLFVSYMFFVYSDVSLRKKRQHFFGDNIVPFYCKNCGYIELYKEMKEKKEQPLLYTNTGAYMKYTIKDS